MSEFLIHFSAVEHLANDPRLYPELNHLVYREGKAVKLGALALDLPYFEGLYRDTLKKAVGFNPDIKPWAQVLHSHKPQAVGVALAELATVDPQFMNQPWALAFVVGYFTHLAMDRVIHGLNYRMIRDSKRTGESARRMLAECTKYQTLFFYKEYFGKTVLGTRYLKQSCDVYGIEDGHIKREVVDFFQKACLKAIGRSPKSKQMKQWSKMYHRYVQALSFPLTRMFDLKENAQTQKKMHTYYRNDFFDFVTFYNYGLDLAAEFVNGIYYYMSMGEFNMETREDLLDVIPESDIILPIDDDGFFGPIEPATTSLYQAAPEEGEVESPSDSDGPIALPKRDMRKMLKEVTAKNSSLEPVESLSDSQDPLRSINPELKPGPFQSQNGEGGTAKPANKKENRYPLKGSMGEDHDDFFEEDDLELNSNRALSKEEDDSNASPASNENILPFIRQPTPPPKDRN